MGFFTAPKIQAPPTPAPATPVVQQVIEEEVAKKYNDSAKRRRGLISTILSRGGRQATPAQSVAPPESPLRDTLG